MMREKCFIAALSAILVGCSGHPSPSSRIAGPASGASPAVMGSRASALDLTVYPSPACQLVPSTFTVRVGSGASPQAVVVIDLTMPSMTMPTTVVTMHRVGPGLYQGGGYFSMGGDWQASVQLIEGDKRLVQNVPVTVK